MVVDNHVHVGWYTDGYHAPQEVWHSLLAAGVDNIAVSSTSTCAELYKVVVREMRSLIKLGGDRIHPILWLTPKMMKCRYALPYMLHSKVAWYGVKLHWEAHPEWAHNKKLLNKALDVARQLKLPMLLHTGEKVNCEAQRFERIIADSPDITFVLAHGRPIEQTISILNRFNNVYVDTAFMTESSLWQLVNHNLANKILFGSDTPINELFFHLISTSEYIAKQIEMVRHICGSEANEILGRTVFARVTQETAESLERT